MVVKLLDGIASIWYPYIYCICIDFLRDEVKTKSGQLDSHYITLYLKIVVDSFRITIRFACHFGLLHRYILCMEISTYEFNCSILIIPFNHWPIFNHLHINE